MPTTTTYLAWRHTPENTATLTLHVGDRDIPVAAPIAVLLQRDSTRLLTDDPVHDLLLAEQDLRGEVRWLASERDAATTAVTEARAACYAGSTSRGEHRAASQHWAASARAHTEWSKRHERAVATLAALREFVIDLSMPDGLLAEAAAGWQRDPGPPDWVQVFVSEAQFLAADTRRGAQSSWGGTEPAGREFGAQWRRDPDDPTVDAVVEIDEAATPDLLRAGVWRLRWHRDEAYAMRRGFGTPEQVWLLGTGLTDHDTGGELLAGLEAHMLAPNSLIWAAHVIHQYTRRAGG